MTDETQRSNAAHAQQHHQQPLWNGHGRSPSLQMRHTVDDKLLVATHTSFLALRAVMHRNGDTLVCFSEAGFEISLQHHTSRKTPRGVIVTDRHVYVVSLPSQALFAPSSSGGCFAMSEYSQMCTVEGTPHVILQFVNGVVTLLFHGENEVERLGDIMFSATGVMSQLIREQDLDAGRHGSAASRDSRKYAVSIAPSAAGTTFSRAQTSVPPVGTPIRRALGAGGTSSAASESSVPSGVEGILRTLLGRGSEYDKISPEVETQTDARVTFDTGAQATALTRDAATSPIPIFANDHAERSGSAAQTESDFDPTELWKSLQNPGARGKQPTHQQQQHQQQQRPSVTMTSSRFGGGSSLTGPPEALERRISFDENQRGGTLQRTTTRLPSYLRLQSGTAAASSAAPNTPQQQAAGLSPDDEDFPEFDDTLQLTNRTSTSVGASQALSNTIGGASGSGGGQQGQSAQSSSSNAQQMDAFLGVLSTFHGALAQHGIDTIPKLLRLNDGELEELMDAVGMTKQGNRLMLQSKVNLHRQSRRKA